MFSDLSYRVSFIFALVLHLVLIFFVFKNYRGLVPRHFAEVAVINAVAINERDFNNRMNQKKVVQQKVIRKKKKPVVKKTIKKKSVVKRVVAKKNELQIALKKNLLAEQKREMEELKKERKRYEEDLANQREQEMQKALNDEILAEKKQLAKVLSEIQSSVMKGRIAKYEALVIQAINSEWIKPDGLSIGDSCRFLIRLAPGGEIIGVQLIDTNNNDALERSAKAAILKASPLPVPEDARLFNEFRVIKLFFNPEGVSG